jgi:hypothetical protein
MCQPRYSLLLHCRHNSRTVVEAVVSRHSPSPLVRGAVVARQRQSPLMDESVSSDGSGKTIAEMLHRSHPLPIWRYPRLRRCLALSLRRYLENFLQDLPTRLVSSSAQRLQKIGRAGRENSCGSIAIKTQYVPVGFGALVPVLALPPLLGLVEVVGLAPEVALPTLALLVATLSLLREARSTSLQCGRDFPCEDC